MAGPYTSRKKGDIVELSEKKAKSFINRGFAVAVESQQKPSQQRETATVKPQETRQEYPKHIGGGWYELSSGEKVQGKEEAERKESG